MKNCYQLKLPKISNRLQIDLLNHVKLQLESQGHDPSIILTAKSDAEIIAEFCRQANTSKSLYLQHEISQDLLSRIQTEMSDQLFPFSKINWILQVITGGNRFIPHRDVGHPGRRVSLIYNLVPDTATTHFYTCDQDHPTRFVFGLNEVKMIETIQMKPFTWYSMNHYTIHGVSKITKPRIAITCDFNFHPELGVTDHDTFCKKYEELLST